MFYFASCMNIIFNSLLAQLVKYDVHTTPKIKFIHAIFITYHYYLSTWPMTRFLRLWLNFQWPNSCANTANTSSLLHPVFLFFFFSLFSSILSGSSLLSVSATVFLSSTVSSLLGSSPVSWHAQHRYYCRINSSTEKKR